MYLKGKLVIKSNIVIAVSYTHLDVYKRQAPIRPPYNVYFQGGLTFDHSKMGTLKAIQAIKKMKEENR